MKALFISALITLTVSLATAQQVTKKVTLTHLHRVSEEGYEFKISEDEVYYVNRSGLSMEMGKMSRSDVKPPKPVKISGIKYQDAKVKMRNAVELNKKIYVICEANNKKEDKNYIVAYLLDFKAMTLIDKPILLDEFVEAKKMDVSYDFEKISDNEFFMKKYTTISREGISSIDYSLIDTDMNKKWTRKLQNPSYSTGDFTLESSFLKDADNLIMIGIHYPDGKRKSKKDGKPNYVYHLLYYYDGLQYMKDYEVELKDNFITDMAAGINSKGQMICSGFYSKKGAYSLTGAFYLSVNKETKAVENVKYKEFDSEFAMSLMNKRQKRKAKRKSDKGEDVDAPQFDLRGLVFKEDGRTVLMAEDHYVVQHCTTNSKGQTSCYYTYHYDDLIAVQFAENGDVDWNIKIEKKLVYGSPTDAAFALIERDNKLYLFYNENLRNLKNAENDDDEDDGSERAASRKNSAPVIVTIDERGKVEKEVLMMPDGKKSVVITTYEYFEMGENNYVFKIVDNSGKKQYYKMVFNK